MIALPYPTKHCRTEGVGQRQKATIKKPASTSKLFAFTEKSPHLKLSEGRIIIIRSLMPKGQ